MHQPSQNPEERHSEHKDIAHPIALECREYIQKKVLAAFEEEKKTPSSQDHAVPRAPVNSARSHFEDDDIEL